MEKTYKYFGVSKADKLPLEVAIEQDVETRAELLERINVLRIERDTWKLIAQEREKLMGEISKTLGEVSAGLEKLKGP
jgi:hypothetical protein